MAQTQPREEAITQQRVLVNNDTLIEATDFIFKSMARSRGAAGKGSFLVEGWEEGGPKQVRVTLALMRALFKEHLNNIEGIVRQQVAGGYNSIPVFDPDKDDPPAINLGNCKCTWPRSTGICIFGGCLFGNINIQKGTGDLTFTFNI